MTGRGDECLQKVVTSLEVYVNGKILSKKESDQVVSLFRQYQMEENKFTARVQYSESEYVEMLRGQKFFDEVRIDMMKRLGTMKQEDVMKEIQEAQKAAMENLPESFKEMNNRQRSEYMDTLPFEERIPMITFQAKVQAMTSMQSSSCGHSHDHHGHSHDHHGHSHDHHGHSHDHHAH